MIDNRIVGARIARLRQNSGLTQQQLAAITGVSHQAVSKWESGAALPDIQTLLLLTRFFGVTVEQLLEGGADMHAATENTAMNDPAEPEKQVDLPNQKEENEMTIQQLMQMAPYMTKTAVSEIAMQIETPMTAQQIGKLAPYITTECISALLEKHNPTLTWDNVRRMAPFMSKEAVDAMARSIVSGEKEIRDNNENINKTINDIGKAFDDIGKGVGQAVQKAIRFGGNVINEVSTAINDLSNGNSANTEASGRSDRALAIRKRAFLRAMEEDNWEWIGKHIDEIENDPELKKTIAARAQEKQMYDWICAYMGGYADEFTIRSSIANGNWKWLGENAWKMEKPMQCYVARAAAKAENWQWLEEYSDQLDIDDAALDICRSAYSAGAKVLAAQIAHRHLDAEKTAALADIALENHDFEMIDLIIEDCDAAYHKKMLLALADNRDWAHVEHYAHYADPSLLEELMEIAVNIGDFDAVDMLDKLL